MRVVLILIVAALAGCAGVEPVAEPAEGTEPVSEAPVNETVEANETVENLVPELSFSAEIVNGTAPLLVNFTLNVVDDDDVSWIFSVEGEQVLLGIENATTFNHTFEAGLWNTSLELSDGEHTVYENISIEAVEAVSEEVFEKVVLEQDILLACPHCWLSADSGESKCVAVLTHDQGLDCAYWEVDPSWIGMPYTIGGLFMPSAIFWEDCTGTSYVAWDFASEGTIPEGAGCIVVSDIVDPVVTAVVTIG